jgi:hypothetical protein
MTYFLCKMIPPRSDFVQTMTDSEKNIMKAHGDYLQSEPPGRSWFDRVSRPCR